MPVRVRLRPTKETVLKEKKGKTKAPVTSSFNNKIKLTRTKKDQNQTLKGEKVRHAKLGQTSDRKAGRDQTKSTAFCFDDRVLQTAKRKHNREYNQGDTLYQRKKGKTNLKRDEFSKRDKIYTKKDEVSEDEDEDKENDISEPKARRLPSRVLDKTGKKVRVYRKELGTGGAVEKGDQVKRKRVMKLDPYDAANKRLDETPVLKENVEEEKVAEISKNAQFRAIQPSSSILSFVEDNLLGRRRLNELTDAGYNVKLSAPLDNIPFSKSTERERIEHAVFRNKLEFFAAAKVSSSFPPAVLPEIAFAGRSNVGKSSLLNALTRQWGVVRTSDKPGLTQTINFFRLASKFCLVDLPGYGFAYAKEEVKESWEELVKEYVSTRVGLQRVCLLVDTKWGMKPRDHELIDLMERSQTPYQILLTKTDIVFPIDVARRAMQIQESLKKNKSVVNPVMMVSSKSGGGIRHLRTVLSKLARFAKP